MSRLSDMTYKLLLTECFDVTDINSTMSLLKNLHLPTKTRKRLLDCVWKDYDTRLLGNIPSDDLVIYYTKAFNNELFDDLYSLVRSNTIINDYQVRINNASTSTNSVTKRQMVKQRLTQDFVSSFLRDFISKYAGDSSIVSHEAILLVELARVLKEITR